MREPHSLNEIETAADQFGDIMQYVPMAPEVLRKLVRIVRAADELVANKKGGIHDVMKWAELDSALEPFREGLL